MRRSELQRLTWGDVDFESGTITVRKSSPSVYNNHADIDRLFEALP